MKVSHRGHRASLAVALVAACALIASSCGGSSSGGSGGSASTKNLQENGIDIQPPPKGGDRTNPDAGFSPKRGGKITYGLEAEDSGGYCLPEAQLDESGEQVAQSVYDTLTRPGADGKYHPYLAKSITHSPDYKTWTIQLRPNIKFSDGSPLTATVVKNNLDAYRGQYPARKALLFIFVFDNIATVTTSGPLTVQVGMKKPWVDFDGFLFSQGRLGIIGQSQLDDKKTCSKKLVGTGPFKLVSWKVGERYVMKPNPNYWRKAPDGKPYPYVDELDYIPYNVASAQLQALETGQINAIATSAGASIAQLRSDAASNKVRLITSTRYSEQGYLLLNATKAPFNNVNARKAAAYAINYPKINTIIGKNVSKLIHDPFAPSSPAYVADPGMPTYNPSKAKDYVAKYKQQEGKAPSVVINSTNDPLVVRTAEFIQSDLKSAGFSSTIHSEDQAQLINDAVSRNFVMLTWRNHGGIDPDEQYVWWHSGSPVNFGGFSDPVIDRILEQGRAEPDQAKRIKLYKQLAYEFAKQVWNIWGAPSAWTVATAPNVHGVFGPDLPDGSKPWQALLNGNPVWGMWVGD